MKIIYPSPTGGVAVAVVNTAKYPDLTVAAKKLLPKGVPFKIVNDSDLPSDDTFFDAWEYDFSNKDGVGERND
jgi:hypothetical protein